MLEPSLHRRRHRVLDVSCRVRLSSSSHCNRAAVMVWGVGLTVERSQVTVL